MNIEQLTGEDIVATELPRKFNGNFANVKQEVESHINNKNNPHKVTAEQLGLASAYIYQGDVETFQNLPTQGVQKGWVYNVKAEFTLNNEKYPAGTDVAWDGTKWNTLGGSLKGYVRKVNNIVPDSNANVNVKKLVATRLVNGQDLNNIRAEGRYQCDTDSVAATLLNAPLRTAFYLDVYVNSSTQVKQVITSSNATPQVYIRTLVNNTWGSWRTVQFTTTVYNMTEIQNTANTPIKLTGSFSHKYKEIAGGNIDLVSNIDVYWVTPATSDIGVTINLSNLIKQEGYSRFITLYIDGSKCPDLRTITYTNKPSGFTLMNEPGKMMGGMVNVIGIEIVGTGNIYTITNNGSSGSNVAIATEEEALDGTDNTTMMTPLRTKQATTKYCLPKSGGAAAHNSIYRGKYLGSSVTTAQWNAIKAGTFDDLYIGDYWTIGGVDYVIAAFDYYLNTGNTECTKHHVTIVPRRVLYNHVMNDTDIVTGAYIGSKMYKSGLNQAKTTITNAFGSSHILTIGQLYTTSTNPDYGFGTGFAWQDDSIFLMNEVNVYGCYPFTEFYRTTQWGSDKYSIDNSQYPIFAFDKTMIHTRQSYWLRNVATSANFAYVSGYGHCDYYNASSSLGVRPAFNIYQS